MKHSPGNAKHAAPPDNIQEMNSECPTFHRFNLLGFRDTTRDIQEVADSKLPGSKMPGLPISSMHPQYSNLKKNVFFYTLIFA